MQINRLFEIVYILLREGSVTAGELAARFEVSTRTIGRDIEALSMAGIPVYTSRGRGGGISLLENFVLDKSVLTEGERAELISSLRAFSAIGMRESEEALGKLSSLFGGDTPDWIQVDFSDWGAPDARSFELIKRAILQKTVIAFAYYGADGTQSLREAQPTQLWFKHRGWYVRAWCRTKHAMRLFRLSRMHELRFSEQPWKELPAAAQPLSTPQQRAAQQAAEGESDAQQNGAQAKAPPYTQFILHIFPQAAHRVYDEFHPDQIQKNEDGSFLATMRCPLDNWVIGYFLSFGQAAQLLYPPHARELLRGELERMAGLYDEG